MVKFKKATKFKKCEKQSCKNMVAMETSRFFTHTISYISRYTREVEKFGAHSFKSPFPPPPPSRFRPSLKWMIGENQASENASRSILFRTKTQECGQGLKFPYRKHRARSLLCFDSEHVNSW